MNWNEYKHLGQVYDLKHLRPYTTAFERPAKGKHPAEKFSVNVTFSHHCFTRGLPRNGSAYDATLGLNTRVTGAYLTLVDGSFLGFFQTSLPSYPRTGANRPDSATSSLSKIIAGDGSTIEYEVFFRVWKPGRGKIFLHVESAYVREVNYGSSRPKGTVIDFYVILHNTLNNRAIHV